jgi:hypothetical protein
MTDGTPLVSDIRETPHPKPRGLRVYSPRPGSRGNQRAIKHGGEGAIKKLERGEEFVGLAKQAEDAVALELQNEGRVAIVIRNARRLQAACDLFWSAVQKAAESGDLEALDHFIARFAWLSGASLRAWDRVKADEAGMQDGKTIDYEKLLEDGRHGDDPAH